MVYLTLMYYPIKHLFIILSILLTLISCKQETQNELTYYDNGQVEQEIQYNSSTDTSHKTITQYFEDGNTKCIRNLKGGFENGEQIIYSPTGQVKTYCIKVNGVQSGLSKIYFENGKPYAMGQYENGYREGKWELWDTKGTQYIRHYMKDTLHGLTREIKTDNSIVKGQYHKGKEYGEWLSLSKDSLVTMISTYKNGVRHGSVKTFYSTGELYVNGHFDQGKKQGDWEIFNKSGTIDTVEVYENDHLTKFVVD